MPDYTYPFIFPNLAENPRDLEVWLSENVVNEEEGDLLWADISHTHADALMIDNDQATGWVLPTTIGEIAHYDHSAGLPSSGSVMVDVTATVQVSGLTAGKSWFLQLAVQDSLRDSPLEVLDISSGTASGTSGAGSAHTHVLGGTSDYQSALHTHYVSGSTGSGGGHTHTTAGAHTHGGTNTESLHTHPNYWLTVGSHRHTITGGYTGYASHDHTLSTAGGTAHSHTIDSSGGHTHDTIADHTHTVSLTSGTESANHAHGVTSTTVANESTHTHTFSSAHEHAIGKSVASVRWVGTVDVGSPANVDIAVFAYTETTTATVDKVRFNGTIVIVPSSLAAQLGGLDDLEDVDTPAPSDGQVLTWSAAGSEWIASTPLSTATLDDLSDVVITGTPADNEVAAYDTGTSKWINQTAAEAGLATSGHDHAGTYEPLGHDHDTEYISVIAAPQADHFPYQTAGGELADSGYAAADFATAAHNHDAAYEPLGTDHALGDLTTVVLTGPTEGQVLTYDDGTSKWVNESLPGVTALDDVGDVNAAAPNDGQVLTWDSGTSKWVAEDVPAGGSPALDDLSDVVVTSALDHDILAFDTASGNWVDMTIADLGLSETSHDHDADYVDVGGDTMTGPLILPDGTAAAPSLAVGAAGQGFWAAVADGYVKGTIGGVTQWGFKDGEIYPEADNDVDLGEGGFSFKSAFVYTVKDESGNTALDTNLASTLQSYSPSWTASGVAPAVGNGTLVGYYHQHGGLITAWAKLQWGSTSTNGTGVYYISLPVAVNASITNDWGIGSWWALDSGTTYYAGSCHYAGSQKVALGYYNGIIQAGTPWTGATGDIISICVEYPA